MLAEECCSDTWYDLYQKLQLQFDVLLMMGAIDTQNMQSNFAVNKHLHTVTSHCILLIYNDHMFWHFSVQSSGFKIHCSINFVLPNMQPHLVHMGQCSVTHQCGYDALTCSTNVLSIVCQPFWTMCMQSWFPPTFLYNVSNALHHSGKHYCKASNSEHVYTYFSHVHRAAGIVTLTFWGHTHTHTHTHTCACTHTYTQIQSFV